MFRPCWVPYQEYIIYPTYARGKSSSQLTLKWHMLGPWRVRFPYCSLPFGVTNRQEQVAVNFHNF